MDFDIFVSTMAASGAIPFCADPATDAHIRRTVFEPLGLAREVFVTPPRCTNVRLVFRTQKMSDEPPATMSQPPTQLADNNSSRSWLVSSQPCIPECLFVVASEADRVENGGGGGEHSDKQKVELVKPLRDFGKAIVVDEGCAEAVLRGSDVFSAGILASTWTYEAGEAAVVVVAVSRRDDPLKGSFIEPGMLTKLSFVVVGNGTVALSRKSVVDGTRGVALRVESNPREQPPTRVLQQLVPLSMTGCGSVFLQNFSSMVPAVLLGSDLKGLRVLDACAAPGGKSSHVLSRAISSGAIVGRNSHPHDLPESDSPASSSSRVASAMFSLVCTERSAARCASLSSLLTSHFGADCVARYVTIENIDFNQLSKRSVESARSCDAAGGLFDRILLDPPCTGLGLRPKLRPHPFTVTSIQSSADYQKKLLTSAYKLLRPGGRLVYSTCTITAEENEEVVLFALATCQGLQLARATTPQEKQLVALSRSTSSILRSEALYQQCERNDEEEHDAFLVLRFGPVDQHRPHVDSVGFFVAVFELRA